MAVDVGSATGYLDLDINGFLSGLRTAQSEAQNSTKSISERMSSGFESAGKSITTAGATLTKSLTVPILGAGAAIVKTSADFESQMSKVSAISGATGEDYDTLKAKAMEMGAKTKFSATEAGEAMEYMGMAGWNTQQMTEGLAGIMNLAAASGEDLGTTSDIVTDALTAFGLQASDSAHFADILAKTSTSANTNVSIMGESFKYVAPLCGTLGYSAEDCATALGIMANSGIKGSQAGTTLKNAIANLSKPTDAQAAKMKELGISLTDNEGNMKSLQEVMVNLRTGFIGLSKDQQAASAATLFGKESMSGMLAIVNDGAISTEELSKRFKEAGVSLEKYNWTVADAAEVYNAYTDKTEFTKDCISELGMTEQEAKALTEQLTQATSEQGTAWNDLSEKIAGCDGTAEDMANTMNDNLSGQLTILGSTLETVALQFGELLVPYIKKAVEKVQEFSTWLTNLNDTQRETVVKIALFAAAIGPVLLVVGKLVTTIGTLIGTFNKMKTAFTAISEGFKLAHAGMTAFASQTSLVGAALGAITGPILAIIAVIAVLVAAFVHLWQTNEGFRDSIISAWENIKKKFEDAGKKITDAINSLGFNFKDIVEVMKTAWDGLCAILAPIFLGIVQELSSIIGGIVDVVTGIIQIVCGLVQGFKDGDWTLFLDGLNTLFNGFIELLMAPFQGLWTAFTGMLETFGTTWDNVWQGICDFFTGIWNGIVSFFVGIGTTIAETASNMVTSVITFFQELPGNIATFIGEALTAVATWAINMVNKAKEMGKNFINGVVEFFTNLPYKVGYFIGTVLGNIIKWSVDMVTKAKEMGTNFLNAVIEFFTQLPTNIWNFITSAYNNVITWAGQMAQKAIEVGTNFLNNIISFFIQLPTNIWNFLTSTINNVITWVGNMGTQAINAGTKFLNNVVTFMLQLPGKVQTYLTQTINKLITWVSDMGKKGMEAIKSLIDNVIEGAKEIPGKMASIGKNIVDGVWKGICDAKDAFVRNVSDFFSGIVDGVKGALGINSPSKVFAREVGQWIPPGVAEGVKAAMPDAMKQINKSLNDGIDSIQTDDVQIGSIQTFTNSMKSIYSNMATYFESVEERIKNSISNMSDTLQGFINQGMMVVNSDGTLGYVGYKGFNNTTSANNFAMDNPKGDTPTNVEYNFYSTAKLSEVECAEEMKKAQKDIEEGFV